MMSKTLLSSLVLGFFPAMVMAQNAASVPANTPVFNQQILSPAEEEAKYDYKLNPNPQDAYDFTVILYGSPANLEGIAANAHYIVNDCKPGDNTTEDDVVSLKTSIPVEFTRTSPTMYTGKLYFDGMLDEDYLQQGTACHWEWKALSMTFEPKPNLNQIQYTATMDSEQKVSEGTYKQDRYITRLNFNQEKKREKILDAVALADKERFSKEAREQLVTIRLEVKKAQ